MLTAAPGQVSTRTRICVGVVTRNRKEMLGFLLKSLVKLELAPDIDAQLVVVENGPGGSLTELVDGFGREAPHIQIHHRHERRLGLVRARNDALQFAMDEGFDRLAFVDDDEIVEAGWLNSLHNEMRATGAHIVGGPVRAFVRCEPATVLQRVIWKGWRARMLRVERRSAARKRRGREADIMLATNNWMMDLAFCRAHELRFDMRYNFTGGEDSGFFRDAKRRGARTAWAPEALVWEWLSPERLSVAYQFTRARDQSLVSFHRAYEGRPIAKWLRTPFSAVYKIIAGTTLLVLAPVTAGASLLGSIRAFGAAAGRLSGLVGVRSSHYRRTTGC